MASTASHKHDQGFDANGGGGANQDDGLTERDKSLRTRIREHCQWIKEWDAAEAERIYQRCRENMPWLKLPKRW